MGTLSSCLFLPPSSPAVGPKPAQVPGGGIAAQVKEVGGNEADIPFLLLLFFTLQFCASCRWAAAWFSYDIHITAYLLFEVHFPQRVFQKARGKYHLLKIMSIGITFRDADVLYLWKEGRKEIILVNYLLQASFSVYMLICRFLCNLEGWKENIILVDYLLQIQIPVYVLVVTLWIYPCPFIPCFLGIVSVWILRDFFEF